MSYAFIQDVPASWEQYQPLSGASDGALPDGLIIHVAGRTDEGYRVIEVWEDETAWECFQAERPAPAPSSIQIPQLQPTFRDLRAEHVVVGRGFQREELS